jgi:hypothetical protein
MPKVKAFCLFKIIKLTERSETKILGILGTLVLTPALENT